MTCGRTDSVLEIGKGSAINRQIESLKELSKQVEKSRRVVELRNITEGNRPIAELRNRAFSQHGDEACYTKTERCFLEREKGK